MKLAGKIALVAGATRGAGRAIAVALGEAGATVICTGRSTRATRSATPVQRDTAFVLASRPETIEDTADLVTARGGRGVAVRVDHTVTAEVEALAARISAEHGGLDIVVNDIWGGEELVQHGVPFWQLDLDKALALLQRALYGHLVNARLMVPLVLARGGGLVVEVTDGAGLHYRYNLVYDLCKIGAIRLAFGMAEELRPHGVTAVALTPGFLRSEAMLDHLGVTEASWRDAAKEDPHFGASESPAFVARALVALATDPDKLARSGRALSSWGLARDYGFTDADGSRPDWGAHCVGEAFAAEERASAQRFVGGTSNGAGTGAE